MFKAYIKMILGILIEWMEIEREKGNEMYKWYRPHAVVSSSLRFLRKQQQVYEMRRLYMFKLWNMNLFSIFRQKKTSNKVVYKN